MAVAYKNGNIWGEGIISNNYKINFYNFPKIGPLIRAFYTHYSVNT